MSKEFSNEPAFPGLTTEWGVDGCARPYPVHNKIKGMDLLTYVAVKAMQGLIISPHTVWGDKGNNLSDRAFTLAEAFLEEREKRLK